MLASVLETITPKQRQTLADMGIPSSRVSEWKAGKYVPGRAQAAAICAVTGADLDAVNRELTLLELQRDAKKNPALAKIAIKFGAQWHST